MAVDFSDSKRRDGSDESRLHVCARNLDFVPRRENASLLSPQFDNTSQESSVGGRQKKKVQASRFSSPRTAEKREGNSAILVLYTLLCVLSRIQVRMNPVVRNIGLRSGWLIATPFQGLPRNNDLAWTADIAQIDLVRCFSPLLSALSSELPLSLTLAGSTNAPHPTHYIPQIS